MDIIGAVFRVLDNGYVKVINYMGRDEDVVEAARMSTGKGFLGWDWEKDTYSDAVCTKCRTHHLMESLPWAEIGEAGSEPVCTNCWKTEIQLIARIANGFPGPAMPEELTKPKLLGKKGQPRDASLLEYLYANRHFTPFEMGDLIVEVKAPLFVFREWHRHRTQSYNEFSGRYSQMPNEHYLPALERFQKQSKANKQGSAGSLTPEVALGHRIKLADQQCTIYRHYDDMLDDELAKEVARVNTPVSRMSKMRAKANLRNWLAFLSLRWENHAQWEIQEYAQAVAIIISCIWPRTFELFLKHDFLGEKFSKDEMAIIREMTRLIERGAAEFPWPDNITEKEKKALLTKLTTDKEKLYEKRLSELEGMAARFLRR